MTHVHTEDIDKGARGIFPIENEGTVNKNNALKAQTIDRFYNN